MTTPRQRDRERGCRLCGSTGRLSKEDALPNWVRDHAAAQAQAQFTGWHRGQPYVGQRPPAVVTRAICIPCNGWMNTKYEIPAKPVLMPLFAGRAHTVPPPAVDLVAGWIAKTVLMRALSDITPTALIPVAEYRRFRAEGVPSARCRIWLGTVAESAAGRHLPIGPPPGTPPAEPPRGRGKWVAYTATMVIGRLVAHFAHALDGGEYLPAAEHAGLVVAVWPSTGQPLTWPPPTAITMQNARLLDLVIARPGIR